MAMQTDKAPVVQMPLFGATDTSLVALRQAWSRASDSERLEFLEEVRRQFLFGGRDAGRQAQTSDAKGVA